MSDERNTWAELFQTLGQSVVSVLKAEVEVLAVQWKHWGARVGVVVGLFAASAVVLASALMLMPYFLTALVKYISGWSWMASSGLILLVVVSLALTLGGVGYWRLKRLDNPVVMTQERVDDHLGWWKSGLMGSSPELKEGGVDDGQEE